MNGTGSRLLKRSRHIASLILRPSHSFRRLCEVMRDAGRKNVKSEIPLDALPPVKLVAVDGHSELEERLIRMYSDNPSALHAGPVNRAMLRDNQASRFEFFLVIDEAGNDAGAIAFDNDRAMSCHLVIDFRRRSKGLGLSAMLELEKIKVREGVGVFWGQVYRNNPRMLSLCLSLGFRVVEDRSTSEFYTIRKVIPPSERP